jgi:hypothetical protein
VTSRLPGASMAGACQLGPLVMATIAVPDLDGSVEVYRRWLDYELADSGHVPAELADDWRAPAVAGARYCVVGPVGSDRGLIRFIECAQLAERSRAAGWRAIEILAGDVDRLRAELDSSPFEVVGEPRGLGSAAAIRAMVTVGPAGESVRFTTTSAGSAWDLPLPDRRVGPIFMVAMSAHNLGAEVDFFTGRFGAHAPLEEREALVEDLNAQLRLDMDRRHLIRTVQLRGRSLIEIDQHPAELLSSPAEREFGPGLALMTFRVSGVSQSAESQISVRMPQPPYSGGRSWTVQGPTGELIELLET